MIKIEFAMKQFAEEIGRLCREYRDCCIEEERREEKRGVKRKLEELCRNVREKLDIAEPEVLLALLDAYEVTRDEGMLQEVLDVVSADVEKLEVSVEVVRLLAYCYYYVEEEECVERAREMMEELRRRGEDVTEAEKVLEELA